MPRTVDATHDWLQRAIGQPDFAQRLALAASGAGGVVFDHADEAAHSFLAAVVCRQLSDAGKRRIWLVCEGHRQRERPRITRTTPDAGPAGDSETRTPTTGDRESSSHPPSKQLSGAGRARHSTQRPGTSRRHSASVRKPVEPGGAGVSSSTWARRGRGEATETCRPCHPPERGVV